MVQVPRHVRRNRVAAVALIAFGVSFVANAADSSPAAAESAAPAAASASTATSGPAALASSVVTTEKPLPFFHGSTISYGHSVSVGTVSPIDTQYQPSWSHTVTLRPEVHFWNERLFARGLMFISQELTNTYSTTTDRPHEVTLSDAYLDLGTPGYTEEKITGLNIGGSVRFVLPTSKLSQYRTQWLTVGPGVALTRKFNLLAGLSLSYGVRGTFHFNQYTSAQVKQNPTQTCTDPLDPTTCQSAPLPACNPQEPGCFGSENGGKLNAFFDISHGPSLSFSPIETVSIDMTYLMTRGWLYTPTPLTVDNAVLDQQAADAPKVRDAARFVLSVSWQFSKYVGVALTALTITSQLGADGRYHFTPFNRDTNFYLDASVDIEAVTSKLF
jgi:hypothetical protein